MFWLLICILLSFGTVTIEGCFNDLHGESGKLSINKSNCLWTIGKGKNNINFIVIKFQPFDLGYRCYYYQATYFEIADEKYEFRVRECGGMRPFEVLIKDRPAVIRYHSDKGYWYRFSGVSVTFYIITQKLSDSTVNRWDPAIKQSKPGEVTIDWDHSTLPSKNYTVVPFYNYTTKGEPFLYIIEHRKETSMVTQHLNPGSSYSFKVIAFNSVNMRAALVVSSTTTVLMRNVFHENITDMTGTITSPGYPSFMWQSDYRLTFMPNLTQGRVVLYFDELDLRRDCPYIGNGSMNYTSRCNSSVYIQQSGKLYSNSVYNRFVEVLSLPLQLRFYSSSSTRGWGGWSKTGMRARYFAYSTPVTEQNWTISLSSRRYDKITASWSPFYVTGYDIFGYLVSCKSAQDWAKGTFYEFGENSSKSVNFNELIGYTNYEVHVLMMLNERETGTSAAYKSLTALITTPESVPRSSPKGVYSTNITSTSAVIGWQEIPRKDARGVLLGYRVQVYNRYTGRYGKEIITHDTSVILTDLSPAASYRVSIKGYTAVGSGPRAYHSFTTLRCHTDLKGESGKFSIEKTHSSSNCSWTIGKGVNNIDFIVIKFTPFDLGWRCIKYQDSYVEVADVNYEAKIRECGGSRPFQVLVKNRPAVVRYDTCCYKNAFFNVSFYIITQKMSGLSTKRWKPVLKQPKPGEVTVNWDPLSLPSKSYIVVPLYNSTAKGEPFLYIIEHKNNTSIAVEYLKPATSYWFKVIAFDPTNTTGSFIEATTLSLAMKNETLRLMGGQFSNEGRVEVFKKGSWNKICGYPWWNTNTANVVCRSLGLPSPTHNTPHGLHFASALPVDTTLSYLCKGTETSLEECSWIIASSICQRANASSQAEVVCGHPSVYHQNITEMTGVITSPGYPSSMMQADYRWTFMQSLTRTHVVLKFDELDLRQDSKYGYSSVSIQESGRVYRNRLYHGVATVFTLPGQLKYYSSVSTRRYINRQVGRGMRVRFFSCREQESTLKNWTISFSSHYNSISANWTHSNVIEYDILGFLMSCNSKQKWANETFHNFGESNSTSLTCNGLIGYTRYDVYVLMMVRTGDTCTAYKSNTSITTHESYPSSSPQGVYSTDITQSTAVIGWQEISRKDARGELLGYRVEVFNRETGRYEKEINTNDTSVILKDLSRATDYEVKIRGYTSVGSGPYIIAYFSTLACGAITIKNQLHGRIDFQYATTLSITCIWKLVALTPNTLILFVLESLYLRSSWAGSRCRDRYLIIKDDKGNSVQGRMCWSRHSLLFTSLGFAEVKLYLRKASASMSSSFFMLENGLGNVPYIETWNISSSTNSSTSIDVTWEKYPGNESVSKYVVICTANNQHRNISVASTDEQSLSLEVQNILKNTEYRVVVVAILRYSSSGNNITTFNDTITKSKEDVIKTTEDVPSTPPQNIIARSFGSKTLVVSWKPVDNEFTNGVVVGYYVYYQVAWTNVSYWEKEYISSDKTKAYLKNLKDLTMYRIEVSAATKIGEGPRSRGLFIKTGCQQSLTEKRGVFSTPNYPSNYPSNANCTWEISPPSSAGKLVVIFKHFDIEEGYNGICSNDFVKVFDKSDKVLSSAVCGQKSPFAVVNSAPRTTFISLKSDGGLEKSGFQAGYFFLSDKDRVIQLKQNSKNSTAASLSWSYPSSSSIDTFYVLCKQDEVNENWKVVKTASLAATIDGLRPSTPYIAKVIGNSSEAVFWSSPVQFVTSHLPTTPPPEEKTSTRPTEPVKLMYSYGTSEGDSIIPNNWEYRYKCYKIDFNEDGFLFMTKRHYQIYICRNGLMRFGSSSYLHWPMNFGTSSKYCDIDILAPYWSLIDRQNSQVFYHVYSTLDNTVKSKNVLDQATSEVQHLKHYQLPSNFKASWVLVVTWDKLRYSTLNADKYNLNNTFQAVLITDGVFSFAMYNYPSNGIQWSAPTSRQNWKLFTKDRGLPVVGWNAAGCIIKNKIQTPLNYFSDKRSGTVNIGDIDDFKGESVYRSRRQIDSDSNGIQGKWFFELYIPWGVSKAERNCKRWFKRQPDPRPFLEYLEPCPCTSRQAWFDERFTPIPGMQGWWGRWRWWSNPRPCALSTFPSIDGWEQKCCYSHESGQWGALLVGHPNGGYSHRYSKTRKSGSHINSDVMGYKYCCVDSNLCHLFYQRRPSDDCRLYEPPEWSWMWGDPHFVTLDGKNYTFNGLGEYVMIDAKNGFFELQSRTRLAKGEGTATIFCAAVMKEYNCSTVQLDLEESGSMSVLIDGEPLDLESLQNGSTTLNGSVVVALPQNNSFKATYPSGIAVTLTESKGALSIVVALPKSFRNQTKGLLGTWNGNKSDDFTTPEGHVLPPNATGREVHFDFGQKWQVNETSSLFTYNANESVFTFSNTSFVPMFVDEIKFANNTLEDQALAECNGDVNCLFDVASTNDVSVGLDTKVVGSQLVNDSAILSNSPPKFPNYTSAILLTINVTKHLQIPVEDTDGDSVRFNVTGLPNGAIVKTNSSTVSVSWDVSMEKVNISFIATDTKGAVAILRPTFHLCACQNGAKCVQQLDEIQSQSDNRFTILSCECRSGYAGQYCENDIDACKVNLNPCYPGVVCKDLPPPANESGYECGPCPSGLTGKGDSCQDIDECQDGLKRCSKYCYNTPGSFICGCDDGYSLQNDGYTCQDINECQPLADCMQKCENTPGSYQCSCHNDFKVDPSDPKKCIPKFPCKDGSHGCQHVCFESNDVATCACHMGYQLKSDKMSCTDINECNEGKARCNQLCYNNEGSYDCGCVNGFRLSSNNVTCVDIDECIEWTFNCSASLRCENTIGSYNCRCQEGLYWIDNRCRELSTGEKKPTPKPPPKPPIPCKENLRNSVNVTIKEFNISEWTLQLDLVFKKGVAREATTFCVKNNICLLPKGRKRRSNAFITFTSNDVNLVGFPIQLANAPSGSMNALVAFYVKFPPGVSSNLSDSIDGAILVDIINGSLGNIGKDIGKTLLSVSRYQTQTSVTTESPVTTSSGFFPEDNTSLVYIIGGLVGGTIVLILLLGLIIRCCRKPPAKRSYTVQEGTNVEMSEYQQDGTFFQNPNAESKQ